MSTRKSTARRLHMVTTSFSSSEDDMSLGAGQEEAPVLTRDVASSSLVSQRRGGVPSKRNQFTCKYKAHRKDDLLT